MKLTFPSNKICQCCGTGGYVWYMADSEYVAKCINCGHYFRKEDFPMCVIDSTPKPKTNADRIRRMNNEELAKAFTDDLCELLCGSPIVCDGDCERHMFDWLNKECD